MSKNNYIKNLKYNVGHCIGYYNTKYIITNIYKNNNIPFYQVVDLNTKIKYNLASRIVDRLYEDFGLMNIGTYRTLYE